MSNKIKAYFDDKNESIKIENDAKKGDEILLSELTSFDKYIDKEITTKYKTKIINDYKSSDEYKKHQAELENNKEVINDLRLQLSNTQNQIKSFQDKEKILKIEAVNEFKKTIEFIELQKTKDENVQLKEQLKQSSELIKMKSIEDFKKSSEFIEKNNQITNLLKTKQELENQIKDLKHIIDKFDLEKKNILNDQQKEFESIIKNKEVEINVLKNQIEYINKHKKEMSIKQLGEDFEQECLRMYDETLGQTIEDCTFKKAELIGGCKPDFVFEVFSYNINEKHENNPSLGKVILEMKTEQRDSENKKTNKDHLKKLEKDRVNAKADFALLITELEREENFYIKRDIEYKNIIIARPEAMVTLLSILRVIFLKNKDIILEEIAFKDKKQILEEFNKFKDNLLNNAIKHINTNLEDIRNEANKVITSANKILDYANVVLNTHLNTIENKLKDFSIQKLVNKIKDN